MTARALNPFPDYAVTRLSSGIDADQVTIVTPSIALGRELVEKYHAGISAPLESGKTNAALCAVRGDYGTGKTHLLNDAAAQLEIACSSSPDSMRPSILRATCIEADPLSWFRAKVGQQFEELPLYETVLQLYGRAGKVVAGSTELTESAAELLEEDPTRIRDLIRSNNLSVDEVDREFEKLLAEICEEYDQTVRRVLSRLVSSESERPARKWISGATLSERDAELLGVSLSIDSADQASSVIGAIAALHKAVGRPFVLLVDELEHFARYDEARSSFGNVTWLKRLLERLGNAGALALVAGHWSAWQTSKDYLDRFPQYAPIDLIKLESSDVVELMDKLLGGLPEGFEDVHADVIATVTDGNMRRIMSLCNLLFRRTDGFAEHLSEKLIHKAWTSVAQRIPQQQALELISDMLEPRGYDVKLDAPIHSIPFDLVAEKDNGNVILVQAKHSSTQADHYDAARLFIDKLAKIADTQPGAVGVFLANGSIDDELLGILQSSDLSNLHWFDLTTRDVMEKVNAEIAEIDGPGTNEARDDTLPELGADASTLKTMRRATKSVEEESAKLKAMNAEFERKLQELDARRDAETQELRHRLEEMASRSQSQRSESVRGETEIHPDRARQSYEAMLKEPTFNKKLRYLGPILPLAIVVLVAGLSSLFANDTIIQGMFTKFISSEDEYALAKLWMTIVSVMMPVGSIWLVWRRYSGVEDYLEFSRQTIRDLYVRDESIDDLTRVNRTLRSAIDRYSPMRARKEAVDYVSSKSNEFPQSIRDYFRDFDGVFIR